MQLELNLSAPHQAHSKTSRQAAARIKNSITGQQALILAAITEFGPITDEEIAELNRMNPSTARPRRIELQRAGLIVADGYGTTRAGRKAQAWSRA